jgi:anti-sigma-K factor RskA
MSQFNLTAKEYQLVLDSVRARHAQILSAYGVEDTDLAVLMDKIQSQLTPVVEAVAQADPPDVVAAEEAAEAHFAAQEADEQK